MWCFRFLETSLSNRYRQTILGDYVTNLVRLLSLAHETIFRRIDSEQKKTPLESLICSAWFIQ